MFLPIDETGEEIEVFTTRPDTLFGATFFVFSVEHPAVELTDVLAANEVGDVPVEPFLHAGTGTAAGRGGSDRVRSLGD